MTNRIAVVLIRGLVGCRHDIRETLAYLNLLKKHACVVIDETDTTKGMLKKVSDFVAYGVISKETEALLIEKRAAIRKDGTMKKFFSLAPPKGGFERKGIKQPYTVGGALGNRGEAMNILIQKMI
jgi:large subunit ribosomal protein L30